MPEPTTRTTPEALAEGVEPLHTEVDATAAPVSSPPPALSDAHTDTTPMTDPTAVVEPGDRAAVGLGWAT